MAPDEIRSFGGGFTSNASSGSWHSYALTPFGWVPFPNLYFDGNRLSGMTIESLKNDFDFVCELLKRELGPPQLSGFSRLPLWENPWGCVRLYVNRDSQAELAVQWRPTRVP
ncbi:MAG: hypothetical protein WBC44_00045 [Planctomycetaceae bacterium]